MAIDTGGPAFANSFTAWNDQGSDGRKNPWSDGITARDYFAAKALAALILSADEDWRKEKREECPDIDEYANDAYRVADAMLRARNKEFDPCQ